MTCSFPRCECMCHPKDCVFKEENRRTLTKGQKVNKLNAVNTEQENKQVVEAHDEHQPRQTLPEGNAAVKDIPEFLRRFETKKQELVEAQ